MFWRQINIFIIIIILIQINVTSPSSLLLLYISEQNIQSGFFQIKPNRKKKFSELKFLVKFFNAQYYRTMPVGKHTFLDDYILIGAHSKNIPVYEIILCLRIPLLTLIWWSRIRIGLRYEQFLYIQLFSWSGSPSFSLFNRPPWCRSSSRSKEKIFGPESGIRILLHGCVVFSRQFPSFTF